MPRAWRHLPAAITLLGAFACLPSCKMVTIEEDRAIRERRSESFDADRFVNREWSARVMPQLEASAMPVSELLPAAGSDLDAAGEKFGRKVGEGSPWTFVVRGKGEVRAIGNQSREGTIDLLVPLGAGTATIAIQTGPVIIDNSLRDALPFVSFNDFSGQIAFAEVGRSLTQRALAETGDILRTFQVGDEVSFLGTLNLSEDRQIPRLIPVRVKKIGGAGR